VVYTDANGSTVTMPTTEWWTDDSEAVLALEFITDRTMKDGTLATVTYVAGYSEVPQALQQCIVALVGAWYANPEASAVVALAEVPLSYRYIIQQYAARSLIR